MGMFEAVSFSLGGLRVYGYGLAVAAGFLLMWVMLYFTRGRFGAGKAGVVSVMLLAVLLGIFMGRAVYCLFRPSAVFFDAVEGDFLGVWAFFDLPRGGLDYFGVLLGIGIAAMCAAGRLKMAPSTVFDWMAAPTALFMCVLRLALRFAGEGYGEMLEEGAERFGLFAMQNAYEEWHFAVYLPEGIVMLAVFLLVLLLPLRPGRRAPAMLAMTAACQMFFESLHRDNYLRLEANGFIRVDQVLAMLVLVFVLAWLFKKERSVCRRRLVPSAVLLPLAVSFAVAAEFYEKLPLPTWLLYGMSALGSLSLAAAVVIGCMPKE